jgi:predicted Zn-dependent protease
MAVSIVVTSVALAATAHAQNMILLRDAEIEADLRAYATPVFIAAGLDPEALTIYLVEDSQLNSFVAGGQNLFMNTGTIQRSETPNQLVGIMAHETGHIAGGHIARSEQGMKNAEYEGLAALVLGAALAFATGGAGGAAMLSASGVAERAWLQYSIEQEARADQAALFFLDRTHQSARGLLQFFEILTRNEFLNGQQEDPYIRTHPLTTQRIDYVRAHVESSPYSNNPDPPAWIEMHKRMEAKLAGFLQAPQDTLAQYKESDTSLAARYARAIAYYRIPDLTHAVPAIDALIRDYPSDPYFQELKGQMLFENGRIADAVGPYDQASKLDPTSKLLRLELAQVQLETENAALVPAALRNLRDVVRTEVQNAEAWRLLAIAYGRSNDMGMMSLALAEQGASTGDHEMARHEALHAMQLLPAGPDRQRAQDIADEAKREKDQ